ncbi:hypothetical protein [Petrocella sp. FN5]|uniref:hypothetical protein n=1 Tax=Petrocella sp. FN5 TaxID=3032002 RepID=UPI0023D9E81E|nr:hypothetical protein [Petrocella sp. FN5]MDF1618252.1 hypothetical protein [Petrocella sp. FN5]
MRTELIEKTELDRVLELMCQILGLQEASEKVVVEIIKKVGIKGFFNNVNDLEVTDLEKKSIMALKLVIETKEEEIANREGVDTDGNKASLYR